MAAGTEKRAWWRRILGWRWVRRALLLLLAIFVGLPLFLTALYRVVPPPLTPLMVIRVLEGEGLERSWRGLAEISPHMGRAAIAAEDNLFCRHFGIDWDAVRTVLEDYRAGKRLRGASTITMQTAKNLFLWPERSYVRKALEVYLALYLEALWPKQRILEVYLNVAEFGAGIYGAEAAARHAFGRSAARIGPRQAALLAAVLPNPRVRSATAPSPTVRRKAATVRTRVGQLGDLLDCAVPIAAS